MPFMPCVSASSSFAFQSQSRTVWLSSAEIVSSHCSVARKSTVLSEEKQWKLKRKAVPYPTSGTEERINPV